MAGCTLLHISDLHFGRTYTQRMGDAVLAAAEQISPDAVLVSGDLVEWAEHSANWRDVAAFLGKFRAPVLAVPGNHDIDRFNLLGRMWGPFRAYRRHVHPELDRALPLPGAHVVGLSSPSRWTMDLGYVSRAQVEWAADALSGAADDSVRVLVVHHGPRPSATRLLRNHLRGGRLERLVFGAGVDLVLSGHNHFPYAEQMVCRESGNEVLWLQAGTATCWRINRRTHSNSFTVIRALVDRLEVGWWYYADQAAAFQQGEHKVFPRGARAALLPEVATPALAAPGA
ncbi:MAG TPA: metallophosphoesterase [Kofleriaceae bacterium]|nr:metallophosphoesterase [Kofleriaceae bacterium]